MPLPPKLALRRQHTGDRVLDEVQRLAQQAAVAINQLPFIPGNSVKNITISSSGTSVAHGLGHAPAGYIITRVRGASGRSAGPTVLDSPATPPDATAWTLFASDTSVTVDLWFF